MTAAHASDLYQETNIWSCVWQRIQEGASRCISSTARLRNVSEFHLRLRTLLQLPKYPFEGLISEAIETEVEGEADKINILQAEFGEFLRGHTAEKLHRDSASVSNVPEDMARIVHERFHYLQSFRAGQHFGLYLSGESRLAALATVSQMDVMRLRHYLPQGQHSRAFLLSRVFAFPWAPRNSLSFLLSSVVRELRERGTEVLLTWVNPNLCFRGSSYRAANWSLAGTEPVIYRYLNGAYITARQMYGLQLPSSRISFSQSALAPLEVWRYILH